MKIISKYIQIGTYLMLGGVTFLTELFIFILLSDLTNAPLLIANSLSFIGGLAISYLMNSRAVFRRDDSRHSFKARILFYILLALFNLIMSNLMVGATVLTGITPELSKVLSMVIIASWNFIIYKKYIFVSK